MLLVLPKLAHQPLQWLNLTLINGLHIVCHEVLGRFANWYKLLVGVMLGNINHLRHQMEGPRANVNCLDLEAGSLRQT
jgi:hypothetical protein